MVISPTPKSDQLYQKSKRLFPGGVNSPVRAFNGVGGTPIFMKSASGAHLWDEDERRYVDYVGSWGPMILGHNHPVVIDAIQKALNDGLSFGTPTARELELGEVVNQLMPSIEMMRFVSSGTEACMSALRLARGYTGRDKIVKFIGCYHGHADFLLVESGSGVATLGIPGSPGIPQGATQDTITVPYNNLGLLNELMSELGHLVAAIIVEPICGNAGMIQPQPGFLEGLRTICNQSGSLLIFDEVMTGFRVAKGGAQQLFGVTPDLTTLGKVIGGGMPVGAYGGRREIMAKVAPQGPIYQAGTLSGHPIAMASGTATLRVLADLDYDILHQTSQTLVEGMRDALAKRGIKLAVEAQGGMFGLCFGEQSPRNFSDIQNADHQMFKRFFHGMLDQGHYFAPSGYEAGFVSFAHSLEDVQATIQAIDNL